MNSPQGPALQSSSPRPEQSTPFPPLARTSHGPNENEIGGTVINTAMRIHRELGPGLLESVYEVILANALTKQGLRVERQVPVPIIYQDLRFEEGFRADIIVENRVILELKSVEQITNLHAKQLLTYLKLRGLKLGYILNFGANLMKDGVERVINGTIAP